MEALWHEVRPFGISVSIIEPAFVRTGIVEFGHTVSASLPDDKILKAHAVDSVRRFVSEGLAPERVADRVLEILGNPSPRLRYPVGGDAMGLPRLKAMAPASVRLRRGGLRRRFAQPAAAERTR